VWWWPRISSSNPTCLRTLERATTRGSGERYPCCNRWLLGVARRGEMVRLACLMAVHFGLLMKASAVAWSIVCNGEGVLFLKILTTSTFLGEFHRTTNMHTSFYAAGKSQSNALTSLNHPALRRNTSNLHALHYLGIRKFSHLNVPAFLPLRLSHLRIITSSLLPSRPSATSVARPICISYRVQV
jgi:hypothetical protein